MFRCVCVSGGGGVGTAGEERAGVCGEGAGEVNVSDVWGAVIPD